MDTYNFDALRQLLWGVFFQQENALHLFCKREFAYTLPEGLPFLWKLELLLMHCQATDTCEQLLGLLKVKDEQLYNRYHAIIHQSVNRPSEYPETERLACQITFKKPIDLSEWSEEVQLSAIRALAAVIECPAEMVTCLEVQDGPVKLTLEMPEDAFERLLDLGKREGSAIAGLGIAQVKEIVQNPHNIGNIRRMLDKMFTPPEFQEFCQKHFLAVSEQIIAASKKTEMIEMLLNHARQSSRVPHVLVFAKKHNAKIYDRYEPYYYPPRMHPMPQQHAARSRRAAPTPLRQPLLNLTFSEAVKALAAGTGVSTALTFLLQRVLLIPVQDQNVAEVRQLMWGTTALFAIAVARAVLWAAHRNRGQLLAGISVISYWLGMIFGNALAYLSTTGDVSQIDAILSACLYGAIMAISPLFSFGAPVIVLIIGTYWAYHYSR